MLLGSALVSLWPSVSEFQLSVKKKLNEGPGNYINKVITYFQNLKMTIISNLLLCLLSYLDSWGAQEWPLRMVGATVCGDYVYHSSRF